jgi:hypothetical protein
MAATPTESGPAQAGDEEVAQAAGETLPVLASAATPVVARTGAAPATWTGASLPAVQAAAVAAGGFVAGAAVAGLVHRRRSRAPAASPRRLMRRRKSQAQVRGKQGGPGELLQIVASRSLLVDVHLLGVPGRNAGA